MSTHVYVDGFNLFYGALKGTPYKWLDLGALCRKLLPDDDIRLIRYFTARVSTAVVITNDSDLATPVTLARIELGVRVGVVNPHPARRRSLELHGTFFKQLRRSAVAKTQLPTVVETANGPVAKPNGW